MCQDATFSFREAERLGFVTFGINNLLFRAIRGCSVGGTFEYNVVFLHIKIPVLRGTNKCKVVVMKDLLKFTQGLFKDGVRFSHLTSKLFIRFLPVSG